MAAIPLLLTACGGEQEDLVGEVPFDSVFEILSRLQLEERDDVLVVEPTIRADPQGGVLVADRAEQQIRKHAADGGLEWRFGRSGPGPEEFNSPNVAVRIGPKEILAVDAHAKAIVWDEEQRQVDRLLPYDLPSVDDVDDLGDGRVLYSGRAIAGGATNQARSLHMVDAVSGEVTNSFFDPPLNDLTGRFAAMAGWTNSDVRHDRIATVYALLDTVYVFGLDGEQQKKIPFLSTSFARMDDAPGSGVHPGRYLMAHSFASTIDWLGDDRLLIQYQDFDQGSPVWHLVARPTDGSASWEVRNTPRLHHVADDGRFYFDDPDKLEPNFLLVARLRRD